ncbi:Fur family transcriptional regulator [Coraliomargarita algicola]|uniref:Fur family transcriptional regulator n=2 Tax=Coraliomargaritaceae TaxID=3056371 RepID=A0ABU1AQW0_9BACT|nr:MULTISPECIES: Fur family transcriptional regulator [unclassified Coraliomargarita]MDQ8206535.1 Fur family transcriptional regulator [Coraliomargarita sp. SDUM461003]WPJ97486.1 Fur family transcriptional regulator [Coraliomargarita sp. J2-16]
MRLEPQYKDLLDHALEGSGQRATKQREHVYALLLEKRDHPTADEVYARARADMPTISLATVYNCLETLVETKLIRQVNFEREPTRYCPNLTQHAHFYCRESGEIIDIDLSDELVQALMKVLPEGFSAQHIDIAYDGKCNGCHD